MTRTESGKCVRLRPHAPTDGSSHARFHSRQAFSGLEVPVMYRSTSCFQTRRLQVGCHQR
jgi:hypothetical protein